jgi:hypothetical protein
MAEQIEKEKAEDKEATKRRKPSEYRRFERLLRKVVKAPPLRKAQNSNSLNFQSDTH